MVQRNGRKLRVYRIGEKIMKRKWRMLMAEDEKIWIERTFKIGDIVKIDKAPSASSFYNPEYAIHPPYYTGKIGRVVRILINPYEKKFQYFSRFSYELQQIIEEKFTHNTKLYAVSIITILPKNRDYVPQPFNYTTKPDENILFESIDRKSVV